MRFDFEEARVCEVLGSPLRWEAPMIGFCLPAGRYRLSRFPGEFALHRSGEKGSEVKRKGGGKRGNPEGYHSCRQALGYIGAGSHRKGREPKSSQSRGKTK